MSDHDHNRITIWGELHDTAHSVEYVDAGGVRTRVLRAGDGPPLVLLHGTGGHVEAYARNIAGLSKHFEVIAYDMLGHGLSDKPDIAYTPDVLSQHLVHLLDALDIAAAHLSGESLGGWVAAWTAAHHGDRVRRLVLNTPGNVMSNADTMERVKTISLNAARNPSEEVIRGRIEWLFLDKSFVTDELVEIRRRIYSQPEYLRATENMVAVQDPEIREHYAWAPSWAGTIAAPTLLLWTDEDPTASVDDARILQGWIPDSELVVIDGAGHWPQWERRADFEDHLVRFLLEGGVAGSGGDGTEASQPSRRGDHGA